ncbi:MAG TPA: VOC family protein [Agromyces sp.]|nr:VOC family protein [Agromyces sp.]
MDSAAQQPASNRAAQPWIVTRDTASLLDFVTEVFGAVEIARVPTEDGGIGHAEFTIGDTWLLAFDAQADWVETPAMIRVFVDDAAATLERGVTAGAKVVTALDETAWGDRGGRLRDPLGNVWWVVQHVEDVDPDEMMRRFAEPRYQESMRLAQETLDRELSGRADGWSSRPVL